MKNARRKSLTIFLLAGLAVLAACAEPAALRQPVSSPTMEPGVAHMPIPRFVSPQGGKDAASLSSPADEADLFGVLALGLPHEPPSNRLFLLERRGDTAFLSDGSWLRRSGDSYIRSDGTVIVRRGDVFFDGNGNWSRRVGNIVRRSDGSRCSLLGQMVMCR